MLNWIGPLRPRSPGHTVLGAPPAAPWRPESIPPRDDLARRLRAPFEEMTSHPAEALARAPRAPPNEPLIRDRRSDAGCGAVALVLMAIAFFPSTVRPDPRDASPPPTSRSTDCGRSIKRVLLGMINDVVLTAVAIGLHELLASRGESTKGRSLRVLVPVSVRSKGRRPEMWGTASLQRLWEIPSFGGMQVLDL